MKNEKTKYEELRRLAVRPKTYGVMERQRDRRNLGMRLRQRPIPVVPEFPTVFSKVIRSLF